MVLRHTVGVGSGGMTHGWLKPGHTLTYPVPEISAIVLFGLGLICVGGYVLVKRKRAKSI